MTLESIMNFEEGQTVTPNPEYNWFNFPKNYERYKRNGKVVQVDIGLKEIRVIWEGCVTIHCIRYSFLKIVKNSSSNI
jgi:hypothetical protein